MSSAFKIILALLIVFALSVLLTPLLYALLPMFRFEKIFNRTVMVLTVAAAVLFVRSRKLSLESCGFDFDQPWKRLSAYGFVTGCAMVLVITLVEGLWGPRYVRDPILFSDMAQRFLKGMLSGVVVGIVEEFFFRGFIYGRLSQKINCWIAVVLASLFYSLTHFLDNGQIFIPANPDFGDAVRLLFGYLEPMTFQIVSVLPEFFGLFLFGILLTTAFVRTRSLFLSIGIHAGCVFVIKWQNAFLRKGPEIYHQWYGNIPHYDGVLEWVTIIIFTLLIFRFAPKLTSA